MKRTTKQPRRGSDLEEKFAALVRTLSPATYDAMVREHYFAKPRRWRFDFAWPEAMVAVETEGGAYSARGHRTVTNFQADIEKYNAAAALGWCVFRYTVVDLRERPVQCIEQVQAAIAKRRAS